MRKPIQRIMVYIDGSEPSITGARYAICLASSCGAELVVCYVVNTTAAEELLRARIFLQDEQVEYEHDMEANAERYLHYVESLQAVTPSDLRRVAKKYLQDSKRVVAVMKPEELSPGAAKRLGTAKQAGVMDPAAQPPPAKARPKRKPRRSSR